MGKKKVKKTSNNSFFEEDKNLFRSINAKSIDRFGKSIDLAFMLRIVFV